MKGCLGVNRDASGRMIALILVDSDDQVAMYQIDGVQGPARF